MKSRIHRLLGWIKTTLNRIARRNVLGDYKLDACILTDVGQKRESNEDSVFYFQPEDANQMRNKGTLTIVADGMGGHQAGEVASRTAVETIQQSYYDLSDENPREALEQAFLDANRDIFIAANADPSLNGMGTTATALLLIKDLAYFAHVGDSRLYRIRDEEIALLCEEHTLVMEMVKNGLLPLHEARQHPYRNVITRALGTNPELQVNTPPQALPMQMGDCYVLCSDGLHDLVEESEIQRIVAGSDAFEACHRMIELANRRGGHDNISVAVIKIQPKETPA
jgi:protein phosphatase